MPEPALRLPPAPRPATRTPFPVLATAAPVVGSVVLWAMTGSPYALVFAALGPLVAIAGVLDRGRGSRRAARRAASERERELERVGREVASAHELERRASWRADPGARAVLDGTAARLRWTASSSTRVVVGPGESPSALRLDGDADDDAARAVVVAAATLRDAPVVVDLAAGVALVGPPVPARALARALVVQACFAGAPGTLAVELPATRAWAWGARLPHRAPGAAARLRVVDGPTPGAAHGAGVAELVLADRRDGLDRPVGAVVVLEGPARATVVRADGEVHPCVPVLLGEPEALAWADALGAAHPPDGGAGAPVPFDAAQVGGEGLVARIGASPDGPAELDLAAAPHALVAGTTGSGKSAFLVAWACALAASRPPAEVALVLVDFKGAAAFGPLLGLPHVAGVFTDLDEAAARRMVRSLGAEVLRRESVLRRAGAPGVEALPPGTEPRLVVIVDEYQALARRIPEVVAVFEDLAARGRSLGIHLVLGAQRPSAAIGEGIRANCGVRVCLRVIDPAESRSMLGTADAAVLSPDAPGRGYLDRGDGRVVPFRAALVAPGDIADIGRRHAGAPVPPAPWAPPLPDAVTSADVAAAGAAGARSDHVVLGLVDDLDRQRHAVAAWDPGAGALLVVGGVASGRTGVLATVSAGLARHRSVRRLSASVPRSRVWDVLHEPGDPGRVAVVIDDLDDLFDDWPEEYRVAGAQALERLLRTRSIPVAASARRLAAAPGAARIAPLFRETLLLRQPTAADVRQAGGDPALWHADAPPGGGQWRGLAFRALRLDAAPGADAGAPADGTMRGRHVRARGRVEAPGDATIPPRGTAFACSDAPRAFAERWRRATGGTAVQLDPADPRSRTVPVECSPHEARLVVGDAAAWSACWALVAGRREEVVLLADGGHANLRALTGERALPPLLDPGVAALWCREPGRPVRRVAWDADAR
ncbi:FtsK/SpoIIIE domain-containing protein [Agromyces sp. SYSU T00194]|uniref:FtsK/SpoIIIE domain-containing protein n=1 Tax=Agromyces chitinivorans TaxID=3158560 RepID=UPI003399FE6A